MTHLLIFGIGVMQLFISVVLQLLHDPDATYYALLSVAMFAMARFIQADK